MSEIEHFEGESWTQSWQEFLDDFYWHNFQDEGANFNFFHGYNDIEEDYDYDLIEYEDARDTDIKNMKTQVYIICNMKQLYIQLGVFSIQTVTRTFFGCQNTKRQL